MSQVLKARRLGALMVCLSLFALVSAATSAARSDAADPDLAAMTLAGSDFTAGAKVLQQRFLKAQKPATARYVRVFAAGTRLGATRLLALESEISLFASPSVAAKQIREFRGALSTSKGRARFGEAMASGFRQGSKEKLARVAVSVPVSLGSGQSSVHASGTFVMEDKSSFSLHFVLVQTDRALSFLLLMPTPGQKLARGDLRRIGQLQGNRFLQAFTVGNLVAPTLSGTATPSQSLTASSGDWAGAPTSYGYQWSRCDSTATTCADIAGATTATYTVTPEDTGSVLRATVVAKNSVSTSSTTSAVTAAVA